MIYCLFVLAFFLTVATGPAGKDYLDKRKLLKERPLAKVLPFPYEKGHPRKL